ncbi:MarR family winged helix-turn-helix transcriptional regulator [Streptomyces viridochromogenes]|uniref:Putative MarR family n=1 Tax=Streptomyces viridochromogenes Tue57 TaxID=1160705 RepID=L8PL39_STRVR|nr:MarR family winged helix-turn-helix transcriptional regulator [Streptomyces viridochromogenes]ELS58221.1 putative MarR family [Streptomyces viridochromogenes Tue57]
MDNMVTRLVNQVVHHESSEPTAPPGYELPLLLLLGFRTIIDDLHAELARQGHPDVRPMHGFIFQAIGQQGATAADLGRILGVSKQAASKTAEQLLGLGYLERGSDPHDGRRKVLRLTPHGIDCLQRTVRICEDLRNRWAQVMGPERLQALEADLRRVTPSDASRLFEVPGWFGSGRD